MIKTNRGFATDIDKKYVILHLLFCFVQFISLAYTD